MKHLTMAQKESVLMSGIVAMKSVRKVRMNVIVMRTVVVVKKTKIVLRARLATTENVYRGAKYVRL